MVFCTIIFYQIARLHILWTSEGIIAVMLVGSIFNWLHVNFTSAQFDIPLAFSVFST